MRQPGEVLSREYLMKQVWRTDYLGDTRTVEVHIRWLREIIEVNLKLLMVGRYPAVHLPRVGISLVIASTVGGLLAGVVHRRQLDAGTATRTTARDLVDRFWPVAIGVAMLLALSSSVGPWLVAAGSIGGAIAGRFLGAVLPRAFHVPIVVGALLTPFALVLYLADGQGWNEWGGIMVNIFIAIAATILSFPLGVFAALGRRSKLPVIRGISTGYIELFRGAPLFVLLLMAGVALQLFVPAELAPGRVIRAIVVFTLFTGAYMAEIVRGGLQSVPRSQEEAARSLALSPVRITFLIVLPQALRNVIPAQVGQFISLFKDTTLAGAALGLFEVLEVGTAITQQGTFAGQELLPETFAFIAFLFWIGAYTMSRESQRVERKLGVGHR